MFIRKNDRISLLGLSPAKHLLCFEIMQKMKLLPPNTTSPLIVVLLEPFFSNYLTRESLSKLVRVLLFSILLRVYDKSLVPLDICCVLTLFKVLTLLKLFLI